MLFEVTYDSFCRGPMKSALLYILMFVVFGGRRGFGDLASVLYGCFDMFELFGDMQEHLKSHTLATLPDKQSLFSQKLNFSQIAVNSVLTIHSVFRSQFHNSVHSSMIVEVIGYFSRGHFADRK